MRTHQDIVNEIEKVLKDKVAPSVAAHSGEIKFISFHRGVVRLLLAGSCSGCAMSKVTLHRGVENMLKHYIPEVESIIGEDDEKAAEQGYTPFLARNVEPDGEKLAEHKYEYTTSNNIRRSKSSNANEDSSESYRDGSDWNMGVFWRSGKIKSTLNAITNYGEGSCREHGVQNKMASWTFRILTPLIQNSSC